MVKKGVPLEDAKKQVLKGKIPGNGIAQIFKRGDENVISYYRTKGIFPGVHEPRNTRIDRIINNGPYHGDVVGNKLEDIKRNAVDVQSRIAKGKSPFSPEKAKLRRFKKILKNNTILPDSVFN